MGEFRCGIGEEHVSRLLESVASAYGAASAQLRASGFTGSGYEVRPEGEPDSGGGYFVKAVFPDSLGNELPANRAQRLLVGAMPIPHGIRTAAVFAALRDGGIVNIKDVVEVVSVSDLLPDGTIDMLSHLRADEIDYDEVERMSDDVVDALADVHAIRYLPVGEDHSEEAERMASSLYTSSLRAVVHDSELTPGVFDMAFAGGMPPFSQEYAAAYLGRMELLRLNMPVRANRLSRVHGDFWAANIHFPPPGSEDKVLFGDTRIGWGEPGIDLGWYVGEFLMQGQIREGRMNGKLGGIARRSVDRYIERTGDVEIRHMMSLPYGFQVVAESVFTPGLTQEQRSALMEQGYRVMGEAINGREFDLC